MLDVGLRFAKGTSVATWVTWAASFPLIGTSSGQDSYMPASTLNVAAETPEPAHGEIGRFNDLHAAPLLNRTAT